MDEQEAAIRKRIAQLATEAAKQSAKRRRGSWPSWSWAGRRGFNPGRRPTKRLVRRLRYPLIETDW